jgi:hypothetical protein
MYSHSIYIVPALTSIAGVPQLRLCGDTILSPEQQKAVIAAFTRFTIANYAYNFRDFDGQKFEVDDNVQTRGRLSPRECLPSRRVESSRTRSPASGLVLATPLVATRRSSSFSLGASQTGCSTAFSPAVSSRISPKLYQRGERAAADARG